MPTCDIIIPTYNNDQVLGHTLVSLYSQNIPAGWRVRLIISDDGSTDHTLRVAQKKSAPLPWLNLVCIKGSHTGPSGARNRGLAVAQADIIFFLGADILLRPQALTRHLEFHEQYPALSAAGLGVIRWDPRIHPTPLMEWMMHGGPQNDYDSLLGHTTADPKHFFYAANLSCKRALLKNHVFPSDYKDYGWEDFDLGRQLTKQGLTLYILPTARALHRHFYTASAIIKRQQQVGSSLVIYQHHFPQEDLLPKSSRAKHFLRQVVIQSGLALGLEYMLTIVAPYWSLPRLFQRILGLEFWRGVYKVP